MNYRLQIIRTPLTLVLLALLALLSGLSAQAGQRPAQPAGSPAPAGERPTRAPDHTTTVLTVQLPVAHDTGRHLPVVAHLTKSTGEPISGITIVFFVDSQRDGQANTDANGNGPGGCAPN
jgi:hypothetical protein